jgi:hypothetical protein
VRLRQLLLQETIRSIALGWVVFLFLGLIHESLGLSAGQVLGLSVVIALGIFLSFTAIKSRTGWELMARTRREWIIAGVVVAVLVAGLVGVAVIVGQAPRVLRFGPLSVAMAVLVVALFTWLGYRSTVGRR